MSLWSPYAFSVTGQPVGVVAPPALRVMGGPATAQQLAMAQQAYSNFCMQARLSVAPNPTAQGALPDGTRYTISVVGPQSVMTIWPAAVEDEEVCFGFVFRVMRAEAQSTLYVIDVKVNKGVHTDDWRIFTPALQGGGQRAATSDKEARIRTSIRGPNKLPYSIEGYTYGKRRFNRDRLATGRYEELLAFDKGKVYTLASVLQENSTYLELTENTATTAGGALAITAQRVLSSFSGRSGIRAHFDWTFLGDRIIAEVKNKFAYEGPIIDPVREYVFLTNLGPDYPGNYTVLEPGTLFDGPIKFEVFSRNGGETAKVHTLELPEDQIFPPRAVFLLSNYGTSIRPYTATSFVYDGMCVSFPGEHAERGSFTFDHTPYLPQLDSPFGGWSGPATQTVLEGLSGVGNYSHTKHSHVIPPRFDFNGDLAVCIGVENYTYSITIADTRQTNAVGTSWVKNLSGNDAPPPKSGTFELIRPTDVAPIGFSMLFETSITGSCDATEESSVQITCDVFGSSMTLRDCALTVISHSTENQHEYSVESGLSSDAHLVDNAQIQSRVLLRNIHVYDPFLGLLCYSEHESSVTYSVGSEYHGQTISGVTSATATATAGPSVAQINVTSNRVVVEYGGSEAVVIDVEDAYRGANNHYTLSGFDFGQPSITRVNPPDTLVSPKRARPPAARVYGGLGVIGLAHRVGQGLLNIHIADVTYWKSAATGAMMLSIAPPGMPARLLAVDKTRIVDASVVLGELGISGAVFERSIM